VLRLCDCAGDCYSYIEPKQRLDPLQATLISWNSVGR
jgi:hypothetical protein